MSTSITTSTSTQFKKAFKGDLVTPEHPDYENAIKRWSTPAQRRAAIVAFVKDSDDIALALKYALEHNLPIAIKAGGHNPAGASSVEDGFVIDLSRYLNAVRVDEDKRLAYVGGGALWGTVDETAIQYGLATTGGTVSHTGVGGLTLGGGYGFLAAQHGLVIDNLVQATVVIADGTTLTANSDENTDLFWAIRGGGSNFGVCAEFVLKLHPQRRTVFAGVAIFPPPVLEQVTAILADKFKRGFGEKESMFELLTLSPDGRVRKIFYHGILDADLGIAQPCVLLVLFFNGSEAEGRVHYKPFFDLKPILDTCAEIPYENLNTLQNAQVPHGGNYYMKPVSQPAPDAAKAQKILGRLTELAMQHDVAIQFIHEFWGLPKICSVPDGATAFNRSRVLGCLIVVTYKENTEEGLKLARMVAKELADIASATQEDGVADSENLGYANYTSEMMTTAQSKTLFGDNYKRMQDLKKKYDPDMVFSKWYSIVPTT
ncbi:hypothetical protein EWM64_g1444 [Hericium alpestre]|uniref:FAD-binding PCMH-type domain-containing protein n=1 Tax=Hericium alpestre TaxID=135208 RepID=A0A4Z0A7W9_9AGAM|nr:hypothetical protein EWM64_g1444 [Hericium alpestre]